MESSAIVIAELSADNEVQGWLKKVKPTLMIRCKENRTELFIDVGMSAATKYGEFAKSSVRLRLDEYKAVSMDWGQSTDGDALFCPEPINLAKSLAGVQRLRFEFTPFNASPVVAEFDVRGLRPHLEKIASACNWKL